MLSRGARGPRTALYAWVLALTAAGVTGWAAAVLGNLPVPALHLPHATRSVLSYSWPTVLLLAAYLRNSDHPNQGFLAQAAALLFTLPAWPLGLAFIQAVRWLELPAAAEAVSIAVGLIVATAALLVLLAGLSLVALANLVLSPPARY